MDSLPTLEDLIPFAQSAALAIVIFIVGWIVSKWAQAMCLRMLRKRSTDEALSRFLAAIVQYLVLAATAITALARVGVQTTSLVALLASAGLAVGLALQGSLANFASGVMLLFFRPFTLGEKVEAGGHLGKVSDIGLFATTMLTADNKTIILPNSAITSGSIVNYNTQGTLRGEISVGIAYGCDVAKALEVMTKAASRSELVLKDPESSVAFVGFGASSLDFAVRPWSTTADYLDMLHNVRVALYDDLNAAGIEIPFNQIVVHQASD